jgi:hypothetical protein
MSITELKAEAKVHNPKIKHYYVMSRAQLIRILSMEKLSDKMILDKKTLKELQAEAKAKGIPKVWSMRRADIIEVLYPDPQSSTLSSEKQDKNNDD